MIPKKSMILVLVLMLMALWLPAGAEMVIKTNDGRTYTVPINPADLHSITYRGAKRANLSGTWDSNWGPMIIQHSGDKIIASYSVKEHGKLVAKHVGGNVYQGRWAEDKADYRCSTTWDGRFYWGQVRLEFNRGQKFVASWDYCGKKKVSDKWTGKKIK